MPMDFPDIASVIARVCEPEDPVRAERMRRGGLQFFRRPNEGEAEEAFRSAAADFVRDVRGDAVEAAEIRSGRGWDRQSPGELISELPGGLELLAELLDLPRE
jgi:hypothetical protein